MLWQPAVEYCVTIYLQGIRARAGGESSNELEIPFCITNVLTSLRLQGFNRLIIALDLEASNWFLNE